MNKSGFLVLNRCCFDNFEHIFLTADKNYVLYHNVEWSTCLNSQGGIILQKPRAGLHSKNIILSVCKIPDNNFTIQFMLSLLSTTLSVESSSDLTVNLWSK